MKGSNARSRANPDPSIITSGHRIVVVERDLNHPNGPDAPDWVVSNRASSSDANPGKMPDA